MSKDPALLFYTSDFLTGTTLMSHEQVGIYIRLICVMHQHGGELDLSSFEAFIGTHEILRSKFIIKDNFVSHKRLLAEMGKRAKKSSSMSENAKKRWLNDANTMQKTCKSNTTAKLSDNANENESENRIKDVFSYFCLKLAKKILISPERKLIIDKRLKEGRSVEEMKKAIDNFSKDDWPDRHKYCDIVYVLGVRNKVDNLDRWLVGKDAPTKEWPKHPKSCKECFGNGYIIAPGSGGKFSCRERLN